LFISSLLSLTIVFLLQRREVIRHLDAQGLPTANQMYVIPDAFKSQPGNFHNRGLFSLWAHFVEFCIHNSIFYTKKYRDVTSEPFFQVSAYRENPHVPGAKRLEAFVRLSMGKPFLPPAITQAQSAPKETILSRKEPVMNALMEKQKSNAERRKTWSGTGLEEQLPNDLRLYVGPPPSTSTTQETSSFSPLNNYIPTDRTISFDSFDSSQSSPFLKDDSHSHSFRRNDFNELGMTPTASSAAPGLSFGSFGSWNVVEENNINDLGDQRKSAVPAMKGMEMARSFTSTKSSDVSPFDSWSEVPTRVDRSSSSSSYWIESPPSPPLHLPSYSSSTTAIVQNTFRKNEETPLWSPEKEVPIVPKKEKEVKNINSSLEIIAPDSPNGWETTNSGYIIERPTDLPPLTTTNKNRRGGTLRDREQEEERNKEISGGGTDAWQLDYEDQRRYQPLRSNNYKLNRKEEQRQQLVHNNEEEETDDWLEQPTSFQH
jgi:hypothetical protein